MPGGSAALDSILGGDEGAMIGNGLYVLPSMNGKTTMSGPSTFRLIRVARQRAPARAYAS